MLVYQVGHRTEWTIAARYTMVFFTQQQPQVVHQRKIPKGCKSFKVVPPSYVGWFIALFNFDRSTSCSQLDLLAAKP